MKRKDFAVRYHQSQINFSEKALIEYAEEKHDQKLKQEVIKNVKPWKNEKFLSKVLYYQTIKD